ncbi:hypothetical protein EDC01DRAFT_133223 [Geopyxis carbonaria]|nr:hypothetical protein EDC01DRAFT_133223 [Geopyxis carbonaria]
MFATPVSRASTALLFLLLSTLTTATATAPDTAPARRRFCAKISHFLSSTSCGPAHTPCLSLAAQEDVNEKCLSWRGGRRDSLAWESADEESSDHAEKEPWEVDEDTDTDDEADARDYELLQDSPWRRVPACALFGVAMAALGYALGVWSARSSGGRGVGHGHGRSRSAAGRYAGGLPVIVEAAESAGGRGEKGWGLW